MKQAYTLIFFALLSLFIMPAVIASGYVSTYSDSYVTADGYGTSSSSNVYYATYVRDDYGSRGDGYHAYYSDYGSERYVRDGYGTSTRKYKLYENEYVYDGYGSSSSNNAGIKNTYYIRDGYGSSYENNAGTKGYTYVRDAYGTSSGSSGLSGMRYVKCESCDYDDEPRYYGKYASHGKYKLVQYTPVKESNNYGENYDYKVKVYNVRDNSYAYDHYPFN